MARSFPSEKLQIVKRNARDVNLSSVQCSSNLEMGPPGRLPVDPCRYGGDAGYFDVGSLRKVFDLQKGRSERESTDTWTKAFRVTYPDTGSGWTRSGKSSHICDVEIGKVGLVVGQVSGNADD